MRHAALIGKLVGTVLPRTDVVQVNGTRLWLVERDEPFAEVEELDESTLLVTVTPHLGAQWAAALAAVLCAEFEVEVNKETFIQDGKGKVLYGLDAEAYWEHWQAHEPLLSQTFRSAKRYPI